MEYWDDDNDGDNTCPLPASNNFPFGSPHSVESQSQCPLPTSNYFPSFGPPHSVESQKQSFLKTEVYKKSNHYSNNTRKKTLDGPTRTNNVSKEREMQFKNYRPRENQRHELSNCEESKSKLTFNLKKEFVAMVIGSGGRTIKRLEAQSDSRILISPDVSAEGEVVVTISGSIESQERGKNLIDEIIKELEGLSVKGVSSNRKYNSNRRSYQSDNYNNRHFSNSKYESNYDSYNNSFSKDSNYINEDTSPKIDLANVNKKHEENEKKKLPNMSDGFSNNRRYYVNRRSYQSNDYNSHHSSKHDRNDDSYNSHTSKDSNYINEDNSPKIDWANINKRHEEYVKEKWSSIPPILKNIYVEDDEIANMNETEVAEFRISYNNIKVTNLGEDSERSIPRPIKTFIQAFRPYPEILEQIDNQKFEKPSPIQCQAWPIIMQGIDCIGIAQTGTGKTLAFLLPALIHIDLQPKPRPGPTILIICPTRELAIQVFEEAQKYSYKGITCGCLYGGASRRDQAQLVRDGLDIIVGTPGRLCDLIETDILNVLYITCVILDEADRMLDLGFEPQIRKVLYMVRPDRQTIMTTATWPEVVHDLAKTFTKNPIQVHIGSLDLAAVQSVEQIIEIVEEHEKKERYFNFISNELQCEDKVMVFADRKTTVDDVASDMALKGFNYSILHSGIEQEDRERALEDFKSGEVNIIIATDVASRGIDVKDVTYVFNFDFPVNIEEYVHRVGRTGRAGKTGKAITLMAWGDRRKAAALIKILEKAEAVIPQGLLRMAEKYEQQIASRPKGLRRSGQRSWN